jgi:hypothetical protein
MDWSELDMDRLYELYRQHFYQLRADVTRANHSLGSTQPEKTWMELLGREEFETLITNPTDEPEVAYRWMRCITRGHENEFPQLRVA